MPAVVFGAEFGAEFGAVPVFSWAGGGETKNPSLGWVPELVELLAELLAELSELADPNGLGLVELDKPSELLAPVELGVPEGLELLAGLTLGLASVFGLPVPDVALSELGLADITGVGVGSKAEGLADCSVFFLFAAESLNI